jgi:hypothetical protein
LDTQFLILFQVPLDPLDPLALLVQMEKMVLPERTDLMELLALQDPLAHLDLKVGFSA